MRPRRHGHLASTLYAALALAACTEAIPLGSECPNHRGACRPVRPEAGLPPLDPVDEPPPEDAPVLDAQTPTAPDAASGPEVVDGSEPRADAGEPPSIALAFPALRNPSFELTSGDAGDITVLSANGTVVAPWFTCQPIGAGTPGPLTAVRAEREALLRVPGGDGGVVDDWVDPTAGETFVGMQYFAGLLQVPLMQELREPLRAGKPYGLAIDVRVTSTSPRLSLIVAGTNNTTNGTCWTPAMKVLTSTAPIVASGWQRRCLQFVPSADATHIVLGVGSETLLDNNRLFLDNVHPVDDCVEGPL